MAPRRVALGLLALVGAVACATPRAADLAARHAEAGRFEEAIQTIEGALREAPEDAGLRLQAARIHAAAGDPPRAVRHLEVATRLAPRDAEAWIQLGELERGRQNANDAYVAYRRAAELAPDDVRAVSGLALTADTLGFDDEASHAYARWTELERQQRGGGE